MVEGRKRSRTFRRVFVKTPGGVVRLHYRRRKPSRASCGRCGAVLGGTPRLLPYQLHKLSKTQRRPERIFGGVFCPQCTKNILKERARV